MRPVVDLVLEAPDQGIGLNRFPPQSVRRDQPVDVPGLDNGLVPFPLRHAGVRVLEDAHVDPLVAGGGPDQVVLGGAFRFHQSQRGALPTNTVPALGIGRLGHAVMVALGDAVPHPEAVAVPDHDGVPRGVPLPRFVVTQDLFPQHRPVQLEFGPAHLVDEIPVQKELTVGSDVDEGSPTQHRQ